MGKILTLEIAQKFLNDPDGESLGDYTSMDDAAAQALAQHKEILNLYSLTSLSDAAAQALTQHKGPLYLHGLTSLSDAAAQALGKHKGGLGLGGLTSLSEAAAQALAQHKGTLNLSGLTSLSEAAAQALGKHKGTLNLNGLTSLSDAAAQALAQLKGNLGLGGLTSLSDAAAQALAQHKGTLNLSGLTSLSEAAAQALGKHKGTLNLNGLTSLSDAAAQAVSSSHPLCLPRSIRPSGNAINPNDKRPFCLNCNKHVSPQMGMVQRQGPGALVDTPGPVDVFIKGDAEFVRKYCTECGSPLAEISYCPTCQQTVAAKVGEQWVGAARGGYAEVLDCTKCGKRLSGPSCFIATAAFGSPMAAEVMSLRQFRDDVLLHRAAGRTLVAVYYRISPPIAALVARFPSLAAIVRAALRPVINCLRRVRISHRRR